MRRDLLARGWLARLDDTLDGLDDLSPAVLVQLVATIATGQRHETVADDGGPAALRAPAELGLKPLR